MNYGLFSDNVFGPLCLAAFTVPAALAQTQADQGLELTDLELKSARSATNSRIRSNSAGNTVIPMPC